MPKTEPDSSPHLTFLGKWIVFLLGVGGVVNEGFIRTAEPRLGLLAIYTLFMGLPATVGVDNLIGKARRVANRDPESEVETPPPQGSTK